MATTFGLDLGHFKLIILCLLISLPRIFPLCNVDWAQASNADCPCCDYNEAVFQWIECSCDYGYYQSGGDYERQCWDAGWFSYYWTGSAIQCSRISCVSPGSPSYGYTTGGTDYEDVVTFHCNTGYERISGSSTATCQGDGYWTNGPPTCQRVSCGDPGSPANGGRTGSDFRYQGRVDFHCNSGYYITAGSSYAICQSNRYWSYGTPTCSRVPCPDPTVNANVDVIPENHNFVYEDIATYACQVGYEIASGDTNITCSAARTWTGTPLSCKRVKCSQAVEGHKSQVIATSGHRYQDWANYGCIAGTIYVYGDLYRTCLATQQWSGLIPFCDEPLSIDGIRQSSTTGGQSADLATDDDDLTCSKTWAELKPWWTGDLGQKAHVRFVHLDPDDTTDLSNVEVYVSDVAPVVVDPNDPQLKLCARVPSALGPGQTAIMACNSAQIGRYVHVLAPNSDPLSLCTVKAFGHAAKTRMMTFRTQSGKYMVVSGGKSVTMPHCRVSWCAQYCLAADYCVAFNAHLVSTCYCQLISKEMIPDTPVMTDDPDWSFHKYDVVA